MREEFRDPNALFKFFNHHLLENLDKNLSVRDNITECLQQTGDSETTGADKLKETDKATNIDKTVEVLPSSSANDLMPAAKNKTDVGDKEGEIVFSETSSVNSSSSAETNIPTDSSSDCTLRIPENIDTSPPSDENSSHLQRTDNVSLVDTPTNNLLSREDEGQSNFKEPPESSKKVPNEDQSHLDVPPPSVIGVPREEQSQVDDPPSVIELQKQREDQTHLDMPPPSVMEVPSEDLSHLENPPPSVIEVRVATKIF